MQIRFQLSLFANRFFIINCVTLIMAQDAPKRRFLSLIFLVSCFSKSLLIIILIISLLTYSKQIAIYKLKVKKELLKPIYNSFRLKKLFSSTIIVTIMEKQKS